MLSKVVMYLHLQTVAHVCSSHRLVVRTTSRGLCRDRVDRLSLGGTGGRFLRRLIVVLVSIVWHLSRNKACWWPATVNNLLATRPGGRQSRIQIQVRLLLVDAGAFEVSFE